LLFAFQEKGRNHQDGAAAEGETLLSAFTLGDAKRIIGYPQWIY